MVTKETIQGLAGYIAQRLKGHTITEEQASILRNAFAENTKPRANGVMLMKEDLAND